MTPNSLDGAFRAIRSGRFGDALAQLQAAHAIQGDSSYDLRQSLLADALHLTGDSRAAERLAHNLINRRIADVSATARCHIVLGNIARDRRDVVSFIDHFQKAAALASGASDLELECWAKLRLMLAVAEQQSTEAAISMLPDVRACATRLGDSGAIATLHLGLAKLEGTRGLLSNARRHIDIARSLLREHPNAWIEGNADLDDACIAFLASDVTAAYSFATNALRATNDSGHAATRRAACANLGHVYLARGEFRNAELHFREALSLCQPGGGSEIAILDGLAQLELAQDRFDACEDFLHTIERIEETSDARVTYYKSWALRTRLQLLTRLGRTDEAVDLIAHLKTHWAAFPPSLRIGLDLVHAELMTATSNDASAHRAINAACVTYDGFSIEVLGDIERVLGAVLRRSHPGLAASHTERALRIFSITGNTTARERVAREHEGLTLSPAAADPLHDGILERLKSLFELAEHPELFGYEIAALLKDMKCTAHLTFAAHNGTASETFLTHATHTNGDGPESEVRERLRLNVGSGRGKEFVITFAPLQDLQSQLQCTAISKVVHSILELRQLRIDSHERRAILSSEELASEGEAVFGAHTMVTILKTIKKLSASSIPVLLTGETGTGKEVIAKIIHDSSNRASAPFIPFNCAAVPRDLIESQLFGHRRGAFSGAHDHFDGVIRAASGGTLFLDEIGEISLEAQPKLLRFLELGEIHPLGEAKPIRVNVRVIAATNGDMERLVSEGQFRDDLFYRLNVIRFQIPPLRERREEIPRLVRHFLERHSREHHKRRLAVSEEAMEYLLLYRWPGNIRQLSNEIKRFVALAEDGSILMPEDLSSDIGRSRMAVFPAVQLPQKEEITVRLDQPLDAAVQHVERAMLHRALKASGGRVDAAAKALGLSRKGLYLKRQRLDLGSDK